LDGGDLLFPKLHPSLSTHQRNQLILKADLIIEAFNGMGCDGVAVGDIDLGLGKALLLKMARKANFPFISSNLVDRDTGKPVFKPYLMRELNGLRIGIIALISEDAFDTRGDQAPKGFHLADPRLTAERMVRKLRDQTDLIILLSHLGYQADHVFARNVRGIDIIVGGHTGVPLYNPAVVNETLILQNSAYGRSVGSIAINFSREKASFANADIIKSLRETLKAVEKRIRTLEAEDPGRQRQQTLESTVGYKEMVEKKLRSYGQKHPFRNRIVRLHKGISSDPDILALVVEYERKLANLDQERKDEGCGSRP
jgi:2',3'-cyclic-nucleotide 2'-phosphodiesterase (5'-nucleotidase family)